MKRLVKLMICAVCIFGALFGCEKKEEISINKDNFKQYFEIGIMGMDNGIVEYCDKMYVSEALDDTGDWYKEGYVYDGIKITFLVSGKSEDYVCQDCVVTIKVKGEIGNIYCGLNSSKAKTRTINDTIEVELNEEYKDAVMHELSEAVYRTTLGPFNQENGIESYDIDYEVVDASGTLIEK